MSSVLAFSQSRIHHLGNLSIPVVCVLVFSPSQICHLGKLSIPVVYRLGYLSIPYLPSWKTLNSSGLFLAISPSQIHHFGNLSVPVVCRLSILSWKPLTSSGLSSWLSLHSISTILENSHFQWSIVLVISPFHIHHLGKLSIPVVCRLGYLSISYPPSWKTLTSSGLSSFHSILETSQSKPSAVLDISKSGAVRHL
jgi:hypothetical protein